MREIKFRIWDSDKKLMLDLKSSFYLIAAHNNEVCETDGDSIWINSDCVTMQYIGLKDKNGKEVYEGDLFIINDTSIRTYNDPPKYSAVEWFEKDCGYSLRTYMNPKRAEQRVTATYVLAYEVMGNIYENPELLNNNAL